MFDVIVYSIFGMIASIVVVLVIRVGDFVIDGVIILGVIGHIGLCRLL